MIEKNDSQFRVCVSHARPLGSSVGKERKASACCRPWFCFLFSLLASSMFLRALSFGSFFSQSSPETDHFLGANEGDSEGCPMVKNACTNSKRLPFIQTLPLKNIGPFYTFWIDHAVQVATEVMFVVVNHQNGAIKGHGDLKKESANFKKKIGGNARIPLNSRGASRSDRRRRGFWVVTLTTTLLGRRWTRGTNRNSAWNNNDSETSIRLHTRQFLNWSTMVW